MSADLIQYLDKTQQTRNAIVSKASQVSVVKKTSSHRRHCSLDVNTISRKFDGIVQIILDSDRYKRTLAGPDLFTITEKPKYRVSEDVRKIINGVIEPQYRPISSCKAANRAMMINKTYLRPLHYKSKSNIPHIEIDREKLTQQNLSTAKNSVFSLKNKRESIKACDIGAHENIHTQDHLYKIYNKSGSKPGSKSITRRNTQTPNSKIDKNPILSKSLNGLPEETKDPNSSFHISNRPLRNLPMVSDRLQIPKPSRSSRGPSQRSVSPPSSFISYNIPSLKPKSDIYTPVLTKMQISFKGLRSSSLTPCQDSMSLTIDLPSRPEQEAVIFTHL